jgi:uncharacterized membrane protein
MSPFGDEFGGPLDNTQLDALVAFMRSWEENPPVEEPPTFETETPPPTPETAAPTPAEPSAQGTTSVSFSEQVVPLFEAQCQMCHNPTTALGGWDSTTYEAVTTTGNSTNVVIPGDIENSVLAQRVTGSQGAIMPPSGKISDPEIQSILDWIAAGAPEN